MKQYLGDSVYISDEVNPGHITLTTDNSGLGEPSNVIHLDPEVINSLFHFLDARKRAIQQARRDKFTKDIPADLLPTIQWLSDISLDFDNLSHPDALRVMHALRAGRWERKEGGQEGTLDYVATINGVRVRLWSAQPPDSCRIVEEEYDIPASKGTRKRVICAKGAQADTIGQPDINLTEPPQSPDESPE